MPGTDRRLPSGRRPASGLTKEDVTQIQRNRMLFAMAEAVAEAGYAGVSVTDVVTRAGVSRATFYEQFADKRDCFLSAFDKAAELLSASLLPQVPTGADPAAFPRLLSRYLDALIDHEAFARVFLIDVYAAGPAGFQRRAASQRRFAEALAGIFGARTAKDRFACEALVAAIGSMVTTKLAERDLDGLRALHRPITRLAMALLA